MLHRLLSLGSIVLFLTGCDGHVFVVATIRDTVNNPISGAQVQLYSGQHWSFESSSDSHGCVRVGGATAPSHFRYRVLVTHPDYVEVSTEVENLHLLAVTLRKTHEGRSTLKILPYSEATSSPCRPAY